MAEVTELHHHQPPADGNATPSSSSGKKHHHHHHHHHDASHRLQMATSVSATSGVGSTSTNDSATLGSPVAALLAGRDGERPVMVQVPLVRDTMTFDGRQASRLKEMERRIETEMKRKKREWQREVERMKLDIF
jgi:hypothetical protein